MKYLPLLPLLCSATAWAQITGTLIGDVSDGAMGTPIPGALVRATSPSLMGREEVRTDGDGRFRATFLPPGRYALEFEAPGYVRGLRAGVILPLAKTIRVNAALWRHGTLVALNKSEASTSLIDLATGKVIATLPVGDGPHEVDVSPDGRRAAVANYGRRTPGSTLTLLDIPQARVERTLQLGHQRPHGIAWLPDGRTLVVTAEESRALLVVDVEAGRVVRAIPTGQEISHMVALSPAGDRAYVTSLRSGTLTAIDLGRGEVVGVVATGRGAEGVALTPDGREVWVTNRGEDTVAVVDARSLAVRAHLKAGSFPIRVQITPDGERALVSNAKGGDVWVYDVAARREVRRIPMKHAGDKAAGRLFGDRMGEGPVPIGISIRPDGRHAYVANAHADVIAVVDLDRLEVVRILRAGHEPDGLGWSPRAVLTR
jgi:YVTN family beta-propeller protein